jgi:hypothetical protein
MIMDERLQTILGLSLAFLFPLLLIGVGLQSDAQTSDIPVKAGAWLYVEHGISSDPEKYTHIELGDFNHLPYLQSVLGVGETPVDHVMVDYNGVEARRAVSFLSQVKDLYDRRHMDDGRLFYIYSVEVEGRYTHIIIVFGETRPVMA